MIIDKLENAKKYYNLGANIEKALKYLLNTDLKAVKDGKYVINEDIYANFNTGMTKNPDITPWEIHKTYTDIQYVISGEEIMGWANIENYSETTPYDAEKDISFGEVKDGSFFIVPKGYFVIFTPDDAHKPMLKHVETKEVKKVIVKVKC